MIPRAVPAVLAALILLVASFHPPAGAIVLPEAPRADPPSARPDAQPEVFVPIEAFRVGDDPRVYLRLHGSMEGSRVHVRLHDEGGHQPWLAYCPGRGWCDRTIGPLPSDGGGFITLDIRMTTALDDVAEHGLVQHRGALRLPIADRPMPEPAIIDMLTLALDADLRPILTLAGLHELLLWVAIPEPPMHTRPSNILIEYPNLALALRFDVHFEGARVATGSAWWTVSEPRSPHLSFGGTVVQLRPLEGWEEASLHSAGHAGWRLHITHDEPMARRAAGVWADRYWQGAIEWPLRTRAFEAPWERPQE